MQNSRALKQFGAALVAGTSLFLVGSAVSATRTEMGPVPNQQVASAEAAAVVAAPAVADVAPFVLPNRPEQWFQPSGRNAGTEGLARFLAAIALRDNAPLYVSEQWGRTTGAGQSDHHVSRSDAWAADLAVRGIQAPTPATEMAARRVAAALGVPDWGGGDLTRTINGYRFQVLWKVAGHFNHVHIGVRKVG